MKQMIQEEVMGLRQDMIETEEQLAQLHAYIYKRREEARKIRLSIPTQQELDKASLTEDGIEKMLKKKEKVLSSYRALCKNLDTRFCKRNKTLTVLWWLAIALIGMLLIGFVIYSCRSRSKYFFKCVDEQNCPDPK